MLSRVVRETVSVVLLAAALVSVSGCATTAQINAAMQSWVGHSMSELVAAWGPPSQVLDDGSGGKILSYQYTRAHTTHGAAYTQSSATAYGVGGHAYASGSSVTTYGPSRTTTTNSWRTFWVDSRGVVVNWSWQGR